MLYVLSILAGKRTFGTRLSVRKTWINRSSSASSTSSDRDNWLVEQRPERISRRKTASSLWRSVAAVKLHDATDAYTSLAMTTARRMVSADMPCDRKMQRPYAREQFEHLTRWCYWHVHSQRDCCRILITVTRLMVGIGGSRLLSVRPLLYTTIYNFISP